MLQRNILRSFFARGLVWLTLTECPILLVIDLLFLMVQKRLSNVIYNNCVFFF